MYPSRLFARFFFIIDKDIYKPRFLNPVQIAESAKWESVTTPNKQIETTPHGSQPSYRGGEFSLKLHNWNSSPSGQSPHMAGTRISRTSNYRHSDQQITFPRLTSINYRNFYLTPRDIRSLITSELSNIFRNGKEEIALMGKIQKYMSRKKDKILQVKFEKKNVCFSLQILSANLSLKQK